MSSSALRWPSRRSSSLQLLLFTTLALISNVFAISFKHAPTPDLDLSGLGRVALAGNFDSISLYNYVGQTVTGLSSNGSQSLLGRYPDGSFTALQSSDASIEAMCSFVAADGTLNGVVVGGNFTSLGGQEVQAIALYDPVKNSVTPLPGLTGQVYSIYCDNSRQTVYVGGMFSGANSTNAIAWVDGWTNLPFAGFNGPVYSIDKLPNGNIVFGGSFTGIGNMTQSSGNSHQHDQVINIGAADLTVVGQSSNSDYNNVSAIVCATPGKGPGNSFLLQDNTPGSVQANFGFGFVPSKIRLYNSQVSGYGTKTWRFTALPINGILNFTYHDSNGLQSCTNECPLGRNAEYQDFYFVNDVGMSGFRVDISAWYGQGGGLGGIELFSNQIFSFAINDFNEPKCDHIPSGASSSTTGQWSVAPAGASYSNYLRADLPNGTDGSDASDTSVVFKPHIGQSGNYSIFVYTPGCVDDGSCDSRGEVDITGDLSSTTQSTTTTVSAQLWQNNDYLKYDQVYFGYIEATSDTFQPTVTLTPSPNQQRYLTVVAQSVKFELVSSQDGLNGLFEFNPNKLNDGTNYDKSVVDKTGSNLGGQAQVLAIAHDDNSVTYAAGSFSSQSISNILSISNEKSSSLPNGGLNDVVQALYYTDGALFVVGNFTSTFDNKVQNLNNVAWYDVSSKTWHPLGAGVNGMVYNVVPLSVKISGKGSQPAVAVSGYFDKINAYGSHKAISVDNVAIWVPSQKNWLQVVDPNAAAVSGQLNAYTSVPGQAPIWSGGVTSQMLQAGGIVQLTDTQKLGLEALPVNIALPQDSGSQQKIKRASTNEPSDGIVTGMYYSQDKLNLTILAGHFSAQASNGQTVSNLVFLDGSKNNRVTGLQSNDADAVIYALDTQGTSLIAGGDINGGILIYDLSRGRTIPGQQPPGLSGRNGIVYAVATRPKTTNVFVGGSFSSAGSLGCPGLCIYDTRLQQWNTPGTGLAPSSTVNILQWAPSDQLLVAGSLRIRGKETTMAMYDAKKEQFTEVSNANKLAGPITAYSPVDSSFTSAYVAGIANSNSSAYLAYFDGDSTWTTITGLGGSSKIQSLQVLSVNSDHDDSDTVNSDQILLVTGKLELGSHGMVSAATYDGSKFTPFALSTMSDGSPGSISHVFVENTQNLLTTQESNLALGFIVLIGLACALGAVFLIVVLGILVERLRRRQEGYVPAPTGPLLYEKSGGGNVGKIAPEQIFGGVGPGKGTAGSRL